FRSMGKKNKEKIVEEPHDELPEVGEEIREKKKKKRKSSVAAVESMEEGEIPETPNKKKKMKKNIEVDGEENNEEKDEELEKEEEKRERKKRRKMEKEKRKEEEEKIVEEEDEIEVVFVVPGKKKEKQRKEQEDSKAGLVGVMSIATSALEAELKKATERADELQEKLDKTKTLSDDFEKANREITRLNKMYEMAIVEAGKSKLRVEYLENMIDQKPLESLKYNVELKSKVSELTVEIEQLRAAEAARMAAPEPVPTPAPELYKTSSRGVDELEADKTKLKKDLEYERRKRDDIHRQLEKVKDELYSVEKQLKKEKETRRRSEDEVDDIRKEMLTLNGELKETKEELETTREINRQIVNTSVGKTMAELQLMKEKNKILEEASKDNGAPSKDMDEMRKRLNQLVQDNLQLKSERLSKETGEAAAKIKQDAIIQQRDTLSTENREMRAKVEYYEKYWNYFMQGPVLNIPPPPIGGPRSAIAHPPMALPAIPLPRPVPPPVPPPIYAPQAPSGVPPAPDDPTKPRVPPRFPGVVVNPPSINYNPRLG
ncbi:hypothetical protein PFISCL1PPCAC_6698, partial [Pristionchus fissidentatus]